MQETNASSFAARRSSLHSRAASWRDGAAAGALVSSTALSSPLHPSLLLARAANAHSQAWLRCWSSAVAFLAFDAELELPAAAVMQLASLCCCRPACACVLSSPRLPLSRVLCVVLLLLFASLLTFLRLLLLLLRGVAYICSGGGLGSLFSFLSSLLPFLRFAFEPMANSTDQHASQQSAPRTICTTYLVHDR